MRIGNWAFWEPYGEALAFATRFRDRDGVVGAGFFEELGRRSSARLTAAPAGTGILRTLDDLASDQFDPGLVDPLVRDVYERTSGMEFRAEAMLFSRVGWLFHSAYHQLVARTLKQLDIPLDAGLLPLTIESRIGFVDVDGDGESDFRAWTRSYRQGSRVFYTAATFTHTREDRGLRESYLNVVLPFPFANLTVVFEPFNLRNGGVVVKTQRGRPGPSDAGLYLIVPGRERFHMTPGFGMHEEIRLTPDRDSDGAPFVRGTHLNWWLWLWAYTLEYTLRRAEGLA